MPNSPARCILDTFRSSEATVSITGLTHIIMIESALLSIPDIKRADESKMYRLVNILRITTALNVPEVRRQANHRKSFYR